MLRPAQMNNFGSAGVLAWQSDRNGAPSPRRVGDDADDEIQLRPANLEEMLRAPAGPTNVNVMRPDDPGPGGQPR
jgi:uncharacterized protein (DUF2342 family)